MTDRDTMQTTEQFWAEHPPTATVGGIDIHVQPEPHVAFVACRRTGRGAGTFIDPECHPAVVAMSRSGNHWVEALCVSPGYEVLIYNRTNTGADESFRYVIREQ